jgi:hypothetical protein
MPKRDHQRRYSFTLLVEGPDVTSGRILDALHDAGCTDAIFGARDSQQYGEFDRNAPNLPAAVASAIRDVESVAGIRVVHVEPEEFVSASAIAGRTGRTRESVRLLVEGKRGPGGFPAPVAWVDAKTRLWRWSDVAEWFRSALGQEVPHAEGADFLAALNAALEVRKRAPRLADGEERDAIAAVLPKDAELGTAEESDDASSAVSAARSAYDWTRYWCRRDGVVGYDERGFVLDPESDEWSRALTPDLRRFEAIERFQCLALLGEPGIGKTTALERERLAVEKRVGSHDLVLSFNLRFAESLSALEQRLFANDVFEEWRRSHMHLHLFLDSLDEGLLEVASLGSFLLEQLRHIDRSRLSLRIACRTADWLPSIEEGLVGLWGEEEVGIFELIQLRRRDVAVAATAEGIDAGAFLVAVEESHVVPLAIKPVTLRFLLRDFARTGSFPGSLADVYRDGCLQLCEEPDLERRLRAGLRLAPTERLAIAERLAAATVYAGRDTFWTGAAVEAPSAATRVSEVAGGQEWTADDFVAEPTPVEASEAAVRETLGTGLFTARGGEQLGWAHQTYAEFLAARYVVRRFGDRTAKFLSQVGGRDGQIVPQLHSAAAWLATLDSQVRRLVLERDPEVLLRSDLTLADERERGVLVNELLSLAASDRLSDFPRNSLRKLGHAGLAEQLRPVIAGRENPLEERALAIDIAELCELHELAGDLGDIALNRSERYRLRIDAAYAVTELGDDGTRQRLRPLLAETVDDPYDDLRGATLIALWPRGLSANELISALTPPKRRNYLGIYTMFLTRQDFSGLAAPDLAVLLEWAGQQPSSARRGAFDDFIDRLVVAGLRRIDEPEVARAVARLVAALLPRDHALKAGGRKEDVALALELPNVRRRVVEMVVPRVVTGELTAFDMTYSDPPLLLDDDVPWLVEGLEAAPDEEQPVWAELIERIFVPQRSSHLDIVLEARERNERLRDVLAPLLDAIPLDSERAKQLRENYGKWRQREAQRAPKELSRRPPPIEELLARFEQGDLDAWWLLSLELVLEGVDELSEFRSDLAASPTWQEAPEELRERLLAGSLEYLRRASPNPEGWFGKNIFHRPAAAGYRSLRLLLEQAPQQELDDAIWARWAPIVVAYPAYGGSEGTAQRQLVAEAYEYASEALRHWLVQMIELEDGKGHEPFVLRRFEDVWDQELEATLAEKIREGHLSAGGRGALLAFMLDRGSDHAEKLARSLLPVPPPEKGDERELALTVAHLLLGRVEGAFELVWQAVEADDDFGRPLIEGLAHRGEDEGRAVTLLRENQIAAIFTWTERHFPHSEDPDLLEGGWVGERESVARWRDSLLTQLETRGTEAACRALRQISETFPELPWLRRIVARAERRALAESWVRPTPRQLIALGANAERRFVANGEQLLAVLAESLERAQAKLIGETPQANWLWNVLPNGTARPRDEASLSDWLKVHLQDDLVGRGIIVNREVEVRRAPGAGLGDRTDIHVDALAPADGGGERQIRAVVEVKGCWNEELETALRTQLVDSYLLGAGNGFGFYVAGWFESERWDEEDRRRQRCRSRSSQAIRKKLVDEAEAAFEEHALHVRIHFLRIPL